MTVTDKSKEVISHIRNLNDTDATEYVRAHLSVVHDEGFKSGIEYARQVLNEMAQVKAA